LNLKIFKKPLNLKKTMKKNVIIIALVALSAFGITFGLSNCGGTAENNNDNKEVVEKDTNAKDGEKVEKDTTAKDGEKTEKDTTNKDAEVKSEVKDEKKEDTKKDEKKEEVKK
jgi:hypothetical protein